MTQADAVARIELGLSAEMAALMRAGRRNSSADEERLRTVRDLIRQADQTISTPGVPERAETDAPDAELQSDALPLDQLVRAIQQRLRHVRDLLRQADALINALGVPDRAEAEVEAEADAPDAEPLSKAMSLDQLSHAVAEAVTRLNSREGRPYETWRHMVAVYPDVVILREGLRYWRVGYTIGETQVELAPQAAWIAVEPTWTEQPRDGAPPQQTGDQAGSLERKTGALTMRESAPVYQTIKAIGENRLRHYAILWGNEQRRDLYHEYFTQRTGGLDAIFQKIGKLPLLYHHGLDQKLGSTVIGVVDTMGTDDVGVWVESQLDMANRYAAGIKQMVAAQKLGTSTGTLPGARRVSKSGEIERWTIVEVSLTPTPADPSQVREYPVALVKTAYTELGLPLSELFAKDIGAEEARQRAVALERERLRLLALSLV